MAKKEKPTSSEIAKNKKAYFDYEILDEYEAGIMLKGYEVKSVRAGKVNLKGSRVSVLSDGSAYVMDMHISPYEQAGLKEYHPAEKRKLLLNRKEIEKLEDAENTAGLTIVPLKMYFKKGLIKLKIAVVKGKKTIDKRAKIKGKDQDIDIQRALKYRR